MTGAGDPYTSVCTVLEAPKLSASTWRYTKDGAMVTGQYVDVLAVDRYKQKMVHGMTDKALTVIPPTEERERLMALALAYQETLTEKGTVRKRTRQLDKSRV